MLDSNLKVTVDDGGDGAMGRDKQTFTVRLCDFECLASFATEVDNDLYKQDALGGWWHVSEEGFATAVGAMGSVVIAPMDWEPLRN